MILFILKDISLDYDYIPIKKMKNDWDSKYKVTLKKMKNDDR